jgi:hypothetical protein
MDGHAQLYSGIIGWEEGPGWIMTGGAEQLSGLPARLDQPAFAHGVGQLYGEIVWLKSGLYSGDGNRSGFD